MASGSLYTPIAGGMVHNWETELPGDEAQDILRGIAHEGHTFTSNDGLDAKPSDTNEASQASAPNDELHYTGRADVSLVEAAQTYSTFHETFLLTISDCLPQNA